jgi:hypothetical protein
VMGDGKRPHVSALYSNTWHEPAIVKTEPVFNVHVF